jgi:DnaJ-class molecular chaperone
MECDECKGKGWITEKVSSNFHSFSPKNITTMCEKCQGTGEVNWVENIFGKEKPVFLGHS